MVLGAGPHGPDGSSLVYDAPFARPQADLAAELRLRILATSDLHAHLMPWDYMADAPAAVGLAQIAPMIRDLRSTATNTLLVDNGDFLQGSPLGDWQARNGGAPHAMVAAMNALCYDAATLGNHEFSHGLPFLEASLAGAAFPLVSANLARGDGTPLVPSHIVLDREMTDTQGSRHRLRIAVTGFAPPQTTRWEALKLQGALQSTDILAAAAPVLSRIAAEAPDLTIALAHSGIGSVSAQPDMENAAIPLAQIDGIDVLVTGHTHLVFPDPRHFDALPTDPTRTGPDTSADAKVGTLHGKPAVMPGFYGSHLGVIDIVLRQGATGWRIVSHRVQALPAPAAPAADPEIARLAAPAHMATLAELRLPLGHTRRPLHSHFALIAPSAPLRLVAEAQLAHWRNSLPADLSHLPLLAAVAPFRTGGRGGPQNYTDIPAGPVLSRHVADLYAHPNMPVLLSLSTAEVTDWLERAAIVFHQIKPSARDCPLLRSDIPGFDFDVIQGLSFQIDLSQPPRFDTKGTLLDAAAHRIAALALGGKPLPPNGRVLLATNSYRAGSAIFPGTARPPVARSDTPISNLLARHIAAQGSLDIAAGPDWGFRSMPGTTVTFDTGPDAEALADDIAPLRPEPMGLTDAGFLRFRLSL